MVEQQYTLLDNGTYQERMDILYPPGTVFYTKNPNDEGYSPIVAESDEVHESDNTVDAAPAVEITLEQMISTGKSFLEKNGYTVTLAPATRDFGAHSELEKLRSMVANHFPTHALIDEASAILNTIKSKL